MASENLPSIPPLPRRLFEFEPRIIMQSNEEMAKYNANIQAHLNAFKKHNNAEMSKLQEMLQKAINEGLKSYDRLKKSEKAAAIAAAEAKKAANALQKAIASDDKNQLQMLQDAALHKKQIENNTKASVNHAQHSLNTDNRMINAYERRLKDFLTKQRKMKKDSKGCGPFGCFRSATRDGGSRKRSAHSKRKTHRHKSHRRKTHRR